MCCRSLPSFPVPTGNPGLSARCSHCGGHCCASAARAWAGGPCHSKRLNVPTAWGPVACSLLACSLLCPPSPRYHHHPTPAKPISTAPSTARASHRGHDQHPTSRLCLDPDTRATVGHLARLHGTLKKRDGPVTPSSAGICSSHAGTRTSPGRCLLLPA
jgi:hypothetical protein